MKKRQALRHTRRAVFGHRLAVEPLESRRLLSVSASTVDWATLEGSQLIVSGTDGEDSIEVVFGDSIELTLNGSTRTFDADGIDEITIVADAADVVLLHDTAGDDVIYGSPEETQLVADGLTATVTGAGTVVVEADAGGEDEAHLSDSAGDDLFVSSVETSTMSGEGYSITVEGVEYVHGYARSGGNDVAEIYGSEADELYVGRTTWSRLMGDGYALRAKFFDSVVVYGGGGSDTARLYDSSGDDLFSADPESATLSGEGYSNSAMGFASVTAYASSGNDWADLVDSEGDDTLYATPSQTALFGDGFINRANGFDVVQAYARGGGNDIANIHDSAGDDTYIASSEWAKLWGEGYFIRAKFFDSVHAYADSGGTDTAELRGTDGDDTLESYSGHTWLRGDGYEHRVGDFEYVVAKASTGNDEAVIYDSDAVDSVVVEDRTVTLTEGESGIVREARGFNVVTTKLSQEADTATVADDPGIDSRIEWPSDGVVVYAADFLDADDPTYGIQAAIDSLPDEGGTVVLPEGTFTLRQSLVLPDGVTLKGSGESTVLIRPDHVETKLTATATTGDTYVDVESTEGFQVGDAITIIAYGQGEVAVRTIVKIESGRIYLDAAIAVSGTYDLDSSATVVNYFPLVRTAWEYEGVETSDLVIEDLVLDGNLDESSETWRISAPYVLQLENAVNSVIRNVIVQNANTGGICLTAGHDNLIENTTVQQVRGHGIFVQNEADTVVSGSTVIEAGYKSSGTAGDGIFVVGSSDVIVKNCLVDGCLHHGLHPGGDLNRGGIWINNISRNNGQNGFHFCWDNFDILVTGNTLENNGRYGVGGLGVGGDFGDMFNTVSYNVISGNAREGIMINGGSDNTIIGNTIVDNSQLVIGRFSGVMILNASYVVVADNTIGTETDEATQEYGVEESGTSNDNLITGNDTSGNIEAGVYVTGITTTVSNNTGSVQEEEEED